VVHHFLVVVPIHQQIASLMVLHLLLVLVAAVVGVLPGLWVQQVAPVM
jgi:hypothetical protein